MESDKPVIVIVPGGFHKPIHYRKISGPLRDQGFDVVDIELVACGDNPDPELTAFDDAAVISKKLDHLLDEGRKAVIVSHSYGSLPVSAVIEGRTVVERSERGLKGGVSAVVSIGGVRISFSRQERYGT